eukprot:gnl/TRDRNA2_/TRDRNA2_190404_c0_seq1.p1 gnl/TRDRNA2_/TRDRNA2_190404_c0~~gnl/TRDRNA2_/TRDRNA2_190404_c0_seq1.p1  ORF type:complete len:464 (+),score=137.06 gnl/TRDRNA2_/TRDRNA2_190404_c0_seq1:56-1447(+)
MNVHRALTISLAVIATSWTSVHGNESCVESSGACTDDIMLLQLKVDIERDENDDKGYAHDDDLKHEAKAKKHADEHVKDEEKKDKPKVATEPKSQAQARSGWYTAMKSLLPDFSSPKRGEKVEEDSKKASTPSARSQWKQFRTDIYNAFMGGDDPKDSDTPGYESFSKLAKEDAMEANEQAKTLSDAHLTAGMSKISAGLNRQGIASQLVGDIKSKAAKKVADISVREEKALQDAKDRATFVRKRIADEAMIKQKMNSKQESDQIAQIAEKLKQAFAAIDEGARAAARSVDTQAAQARASVKNQEAQDIAEIRKKASKARTDTMIEAAKREHAVAAEEASAIADVTLRATQEQAQNAEQAIKMASAMRRLMAEGKEHMKIGAAELAKQHDENVVEQIELQGKKNLPFDATVREAEGDGLRGMANTGLQVALDREAIKQKEAEQDSMSATMHSQLQPMIAAVVS